MQNQVDKTTNVNLVLSENILKEEIGAFAKSTVVNQQCC
jgi:hypothetical protein